MAQKGCFERDWPYKILYILSMTVSKLIEFRGSTLADLRDFPVLARRESGYRLD